MPDMTIANTLSLRPHQLVSMRLKRAGQIRIVSGQVWITIEADANDYWLSAGETLPVARGRHVVIETGAALSEVDVFHSCCAAVAT